MPSLPESAAASPRVFLSHAGADSAEAREFVEILRRSGVDVWFDRDSLLPGDQWMQALEGAIQNSTAMIVYVGRLGVQQWVDREVRLGLELNTRDPNAFKLIPVFGDGADVEHLPPFLRQQQGIVARDPEALPRLLTVLGRGDARPAVPSAYWTTHSPFRNLQSFEPEDAWLFFGRDRDTSELLEHLQESRMLVVIGNSGSGKSSLVMAGLIPALRRGRFRVDSNVVESWTIAVVRPGADPFGELVDRLPRQLAPDLSPADRDALITRWRETFPRGGDALRNGLAAVLTAPGRTLLFVDQFEELFTLAPRRERERYIDALLRTVESDRVHLIVTLRADFYAHCLTYEALKPHLQRNYSLLLMKPDQLREAIEKRVALARMRTEAGLTDALIADAGSEPGNLALLEHALAQLWDPNVEKFKTAPMTNRRYDEIGRLKGAIGKHAHLVYRGLPPEEQRLARSVFLELVHLGEGAQDTGRRVPKETLLALGTPEAAAPLLEELAAKRLIAISGGIRQHGSTQAFVEVSHEALIREWADLRRWVDEDREDLRFGRRLATDAEEWHRSKDPGGLLRGARLLKAKEWLSTRKEVLGTIRALVDESGAKEQVEREAQEQARREREAQLTRIALEQERTARAQRFSRWLLASVAIVVLLIGAAVIYQSREVSRQRSRVLIGNAEEAIGRRAYDRALRFAILAARSTWLSPSAPGADAQVSRTGHLAPQLAQLSHDHTVVSAAFSPDGQRLLTASYDKTARLWDAQTGKELARFPHDAFVRSAAFSPDGERLVTASDDKTARLWDAQAGKEIARFTHDGVVVSAAFSPDGERLVTASDDNTARVWDAQTGREIARVTHDRLGVLSAAFSPDGQRLLTASADRTARLWDAQTGKELARFPHDAFVRSAAFSPNGQRLVTASDDKMALLWDAQTGKEIARFTHDAFGVRSAAFSPDGQRLVTASADKTARLWHAQTGREIARFPHDAPVVRAAFSPDGERLVTASDDKTARLWEAQVAKEIARFTHDDVVVSAAFSPDGQRLLTASADKTARLWNAQVGREIARFIHDAFVVTVAFSPDGQRLATASYDKTARLWDAQTGKELARFPHDAFVRSAAFSPDGQRLVTASADKTTRLWDPQTGKEVARFRHDASVRSAVFSPDGQRLVTASDDMRLWDAQTGKEIARFPHDAFVTSAAFSPDGQRLVTASDGKARLWDARTGKEIARFRHDASVWSAVFSPDGQRLLTASDDKTARLWEAQTRKEIARFTHDDVVWSAAFSPDAQRLLTASGDKTARLWDAQTLKEVASFTHDALVASAAFSPDGQHIVTASGDHTARLWDARWLTRYGATLIEMACPSRGLVVRRLSANDTSAAPVLAGHEGEDVCSPPSLVERLTTWLRRLGG